jgi:hypothetical protein
VARGGGGFRFHDLHCDRCGECRTVGFAELGELHLRFLKGLSVPYAVATSKHDRYVQEHFPGEPISEEEYRLGVEEFVGACSCGGHFRFDAPTRCPKCSSTDLEYDASQGVTYD